MKVTVCQLDNRAFAADWERLVTHVKDGQSNLVVLPEMPFCSWFAANQQFDLGVWQTAVDDHEAWLTRLDELAPAVVVGSRPVNVADQRLNEGFVWDVRAGYRGAHTKVYLPDEPGFWEASWYERGPKNFMVAQVGAVRLGLLLCTDLWFMEHARAYGRDGAHLITVPRSSLIATVDKWLLAGRVAAISAGAFCLSSNRAGYHGSGLTFGGCGWIVGPEGDVLGTTSEAQPFLTLDINIRQAESAKQTYPRYVLE